MDNVNKPFGRFEYFENKLSYQPVFRIKQISRAFFDSAIRGWEDVSTLPKNVREMIVGDSVPFISVEVANLVHDDAGETFKAALRLWDGELIEAVLMKNGRGYWTICVSAQVGCAMGCSFCATGKMGLSRQLSVDEIVDQLRVWQWFLADHPDMEQYISNIVYMGMGEPMANYENVRDSLNLILENTDIGPTHITVSSVGVLPVLEKLLDDEKWPHVKIAISLHSADEETRKRIVPTSYDEFLPRLSRWAKMYLERFGNRRHHLTFEYVMLNGVNDSKMHAEVLAKYVESIGNVKVNLIPYNATDDEFEPSLLSALNLFEKILEAHDVVVTIRHSKGQDIAAACGQLALDS